MISSKEEEKSQISEFYAPATYRIKTFQRHTKQALSKGDFGPQQKGYLEKEQARQADLVRSSLLPAGIFIDFMLACCRRFRYNRARRTDGGERVKLYSGKTGAGNAPSSRFFFFFLNSSPSLYYLNGWNRLKNSC